jgi:hypothetical protein
MRRTPTILFLSGVLTVCALASAFTASASAAWKFNGTQLVGTEAIVGEALEDRLAIPSLTTKCELAYKMTIFNSAGVGKGEITEVQLKNCSTASKACTVESASAKKTPWPLHLTTIGGKNYVIVEKIRFDFFYGGEECVLAETLVTVTGSAGGLFDNTTSTIAFNALNFAETGTGLTTFGTSVEWACILTIEATGLHKEQVLTVP